MALTRLASIPPKPPIATQDALNASHRSFKPTIPTNYGVKRSRTADLCNAIAALYQLSYNPECHL